ncbi:MAG: Rne/Rng family ribonuclease [Alphaproteobacteria bacterium]|nr:Rne/Rng family ribonuclease [Alphaproteobacteria bacterium]
MAKRILVDAIYPNETRVVIADNNRIENFDYETAAKKQSKGNVYLGKITRVEPSLQAAFVEYGEDKHGFLPFSEIHPNYYQIPVEDKEELLSEAIGSSSFDDDDDSHDNHPPLGVENLSDSPAAGDDYHADHAEESIAEDESARESDSGDDGEGEEEGGRAVFKRSQILRRYKIQEVVKRNQVVLVQVLKEERGNKGATLTTFISLAGRCCVFKPNSPRQGGVSRRISNPEERRYLKSVLQNVNIKEEGSIIIRTAGASKTEQELRRDYEYLSRLWENIVEHTISSSAPAFIHAEGDLIKRAIRDLCDDDVDEILIEGEEAYKAAHEFARIIMPSTLSRVKLYKGKVPIFTRYHIEQQMNSFFENNAPLPSGGYLVINQTEALTAIDVNSGKSTSERNVEETALKTNLEAAQEVARQLRLRDQSGLIVVDFIDMMESKNRRSVERVLRDSLQQDRARIQIGRISSFGLLEMSRQRLRPSFIETNTITCPHCKGNGRVMAPSTVAAMFLRSVKAEISKGEACEIVGFVPATVGFYLFNNKRYEIRMLEDEYQSRITLEFDTNRVDDFRLERRKLNRSRLLPKEPLTQGIWSEPIAEAAIDGADNDGDDHEDFVPVVRHSEHRAAPRGKRRNAPAAKRQEQNIPKHGGRAKQPSKAKAPSVIKGLWQRLID